MRNSTKELSQSYRGCLSLDYLLYVNELQYRAKNSTFWGCVNTVLLAIVLYNLDDDYHYQRSTFYVNFKHVKYFLAIVFFLNVLYHIMVYTITYMKREAFMQQHKQSETTSPTKLPSGHSEISQLNKSQTFWHSSFNNSSLRNSTPRRESATAFSLQQSPIFYDPPSINISDEQSLNEYLKVYDHLDKSLNTSGPHQQSNSSASLSFWNQYPKNIEGSPLLKNNEYQYLRQVSSTNQFGKTSPMKICEDGGSTSPSLVVNDRVWIKLNVELHTLSKWNANLRTWITQTILERLVKEFDRIDEQLAKHGFIDIKIGKVGLQQLRKTAQNVQVINYIPTLVLLVPFLEVCPNQEYLIERIKQLAKVGCMSEFKWNGGGKNWDESLPTDAEIIMHLFSVYMDGQLLPSPNKPEAKPFSGVYFIKNSPTEVKSIAIQQVNEKPPHYQVITEKELYDFPKGHNNLINCILLFLYLIKEREHGILGRVNFGRSGVNVLWIIQN